MKISQELLTEWRVAAERIRVSSLLARNATRAGDTTRATELAQVMHDVAVVLGLTLEHSGAQPPWNLQLERDVSICQLSSDSNRELASLLRRSIQASTKVDKERNIEDRGTGRSGILTMLLHEVECELNEKSNH